MEKQKSDEQERLLRRYGKIIDEIDEVEHDKKELDTKK